MKLTWTRIAFTATTALTIVTPAAAQDAGGGGANDIVVTARRVEERLQDVPISISVFNQQELANRNVTNAQDLANFTPSLSVNTGFGPENSTFAIRGFVQETGTGPSVGVYFADVVAPRGASQGFPAGDGAGPGAFFDLQNVQVLKGPQGTLFGRNTTGGAVLLVPQKPTGDFEGYAEGSIGNYDMRRLQGVINAPLGETLRLRLGADYQKRDGFMKNDTGIGAKAFDDVDYLALRGSLVWDVTPDIENYTVASFTDSDNNGHVQKLFACNPSAAQTNLLGQLACAQLRRYPNSGFYNVASDMPDPYSKLKQWQVINTTTWQVNDNLQVKNIASYAKLKTRVHSDLFGTNFVIPQGFFAPAIPNVFPGFPGADTPLGFAVIRNIPGGYSSNQTTFTEEFRLQGKALDGKLDWQAGAYYENATPNGFIGSQSPVTLGCSDPDNLICTDLLGIGVVNYTVAKNSMRTIGLYGQATYKITDQLSLTGGFRYTWDRVRSISRGLSYRFPTGVPDASALPAVCTLPSDPSQPDSVLPLCQYDRKASFSAPTWLIGLDYKPNDDMMIYGKYSRGYRTGGIKSDVPVEFVVFQPEKVDTFEVGAKTSFNGAVRGSFNISAFYNTFSNQQIQFGFNANPCFTTVGGVCQAAPVTPTAGPVNVGKSRIWGVEADGRIGLFDGFTLTAAYTYLNTRVKEVVTPTLPVTSLYSPAGFVNVGDSLTLSPKHKLTLGAEYVLPLAESAGEVSVGANYSYIARQRTGYTIYNGNVSFDGLPSTGTADFRQLPSYQLVDLNLNWKNVAGSPVDLTIFATNLLKEKYYLGTTDLMAGGGFAVGTVGAPQMYGVRVKFRFGTSAN